MPRSRLSQNAARRAARPLIIELGEKDRSRLESLLNLVRSDGYISLGEALAATFPNQSREAALTAFRQLRGRIKDAATEASVNFILDADTQTRTAPEQRTCWFAGDDSAVAELSAVGQLETAGIHREPQDILQPTEIRNGKPVIRYFVSYVHKDASLKNDLMDRLRDRLKGATAYCYEGWEDRDIVVGERWHEKIQSAIANCHFGLLLVSPAFLTSDYVGKHELPQFVSDEPSSPMPGKRAIPVALKRIPFDGSMDLKGLKELQTGGSH